MGNTYIVEFYYRDELKCSIKKSAPHAAMALILAGSNNEELMNWIEVDCDYAAEHYSIKIRRL